MNAKQRRNFTRDLFRELREATQTELEAALIEAAKHVTSVSKLNARLQEENAGLRAEVELLRADKHNLYRSWSEIRLQLSASQLDATRLREELDILTQRCSSEGFTKVRSELIMNARKLLKGL